MMFPPKVIGAFAAVAILALGLIFHISSDRSVAKQLVEVQAELAVSRDKVKTLEGQLVSVTEKKADFEVRLKESDDERMKVLKELDEKLTSIAKAPAPADCKGAVNWVRKNKDLL